MTKPLVLVLAPTPYFSNRGCHIRIYEESKVIQSLGYDLVLATYSLGRDLGNFPIQRTGRLPWYRKTSAGPAWSKLILDLKLFFLAKRLIKQQRPVLIHAHLHESAWLAWLLKKRFHLPVILDLQSSLPDELASYGGIWKLIAPLLGWYQTWSIRMADVVIASSAKVHPQAIVVPDGIPAIVQQSVTKKYDVVYSGGIGKQKGTDVLLDALEIIRQQRPINVLMITPQQPVPYEQLLPVLAQAKVGIEPKPLQSTEGSGKLLNYLAAGIQPVTLDPADPTAAGLAANIVKALAGHGHTYPATYWKDNAAILKQVYDTALHQS